jgi:hypothetical protein
MSVTIDSSDDELNVLSAASEDEGGTINETMPAENSCTY